MTSLKLSNLFLYYGNKPLANVNKRFYVLEVNKNTI